MKSKYRVISLMAACLIWSYIFWPNSSYQSVSFDQIAPSVVATVGPYAHSHEKCQRYFDIVRASASSPPSNSRYLSGDQISNHVDHLRMYLKCHLDLRLNETVESALMGRELLPMFSGELPLAPSQNWTSFFSHSGYYWVRYLQASRGRGIVISLDDANTEFACRLLQVLHHLNNTLPIQFIYKDDLSTSSIDKLRQMAKGKQIVEFMDVSPTLKRGYGAVFHGYNNKWFATLFSTFDEIILMDADVVPFVNPETFFELEGYRQTGAYFFRDRELSERISQAQFDFFTSLIPKSDTIFNFTIDQKKYENNFFNFRSKHVMESGVVVFQRSSHLSGILISLALQYWFRSGRIMYGDKDLFWLGQMISGNTNFYFNKNAAAAIGTMEANDTICSTQLAHFSDELELLWINGALNVCKRDTWLFDFLKYSHLREKFNYSMFQLKDNYRGSVEFRQAILPASIDRLNEPNSTQIVSHYKKDHNRGCGGIYYCASSDGGGELINFSFQERERYREIISAWSYSGYVL